VILGFRRGVHEIATVLGCHAALIRS